MCCVRVSIQALCVFACLAVYLLVAHGRNCWQQERDIQVARQPATLTDLEGYAEDTMSSLLYLTLQAGGVNEAAADHAASHLVRYNTPNTLHPRRQ